MINCGSSMKAYRKMNKQNQIWNSYNFKKIIMKNMEKFSKKEYKNFIYKSVALVRKELSFVVLRLTSETSFRLLSSFWMFSSAKSREFFWICSRWFSVNLSVLKANDKLRNLFWKVQKEKFSWTKQIWTK